MTAWDNFLFSLVILFVTPFAALLVSLAVSKIVQFLTADATQYTAAKPKRVGTPMRHVDSMGLHQAS